MTTPADRIEVFRRALGLLPPADRAAAEAAFGRLEGETGRLVRALAEAAAEARDAADRHLERVEAIGETAEIVGAAGDLERILVCLLRIAVRITGAAVGAIFLAEDLDGARPPRVAWGLDEEIARGLRDAEGRPVVPRVVEEGAPLVAPSVEAAGLEVSNLARVPRSVGVFPLAFEGARLGALVVADAPPDRLGPADVAATATVCALAAAALVAERREEERRRAQRLESEVSVARDVQAHLLPRALPRIAGWTIAGATEPAREVGGDYFDSFSVGSGRYALVVADVSGKGIPAGLLMTGLRAYLRASAPGAAEPAEVVAALNRRLAEDATEDRFVTLVYALLDAPAGEVRVVSAGHLPPLVARAGGVVESIEGGGAPLGIDPDERYESRTVAIAPGDRLVLYTDGVVETAVGDGLLGEARLRRLVAALPVDAARALAQLRAEIWSASEGPPRDDLTILVLARAT